MGYTLTRNANFSSVRSLPTPEQEAIAATNHNHMKVLGFDPPIAFGSPKQIHWAKAIAKEFLFYAHAWGFKAEQIDLLFANRGKNAKFWIDNRCERSGEGTTRIAVEKELESMERDRLANKKPEAELRKLAKRF